MRVEWHTRSALKRKFLHSFTVFHLVCSLFFFKYATAYLLYDNGYSVWMGNARGTRPSKAHLHFNTTSKKYWSFSLHEIAVYDCKSFIDFILEKTNQTQLHYVGYSQGTTLFFILTSTLPEYNAKIRSMVAMAPAVRMTNSRHTFLNILSKYYGLIKEVLDYYKIYSIDYGNRALRWLAEFACKKIETESPFLCQFILFFLDSNQINCVSVHLRQCVAHINLNCFPHSALMYVRAYVPHNTFNCNSI